MPTPSLDKTYNPSSVEDKWYDHWIQNKYFSADSNSDKEPYTIVIPPPNVTGMLTVGHVLNNTIQDILIRKARMEGKEACWIPGTDHASIATESKVVSMLKQQGIKKSDLTREQFLEHAWDWKQKYGGIIIRQLKKLGCSCDWDRERFTMDDSYTESDLSAFVKLYEKDLIYRGHRLVNWCPISKSAISDEEVIHKEVNGHIWHFRYPIKGEKEYLVVATTRPETMLGDSAVAINPKDDRYQHLIGKTVILPLAGREIPIILDDYVDPDFGTGCVKVTPAHDPNDFIMGERHNLDFINIMNEDASINNSAPEKYIGLSREDARNSIVKDMDVEGLLDKREDYTNKVGFSERGNVPIEFYMSEQWFMRMSKLAEPAITSVNEGKIKFHPQHWTKTYNHWMENIKDWCISRQLWWGHQIPVWYHKEDPEKIHVSINGPNDPENWEQDTDVLDTWASSWLWPMAVHGWPEKSEDLNKFFPTSTLVTGPDIIFFWVARMIITGHEFMDEIPFRDVYFTSILRDETGLKLSKSLGNSPDPFDLFDEFGTDAVRFGTMLMAPQGLDVLFSKDRLEIGRNFMNKLWNACRFIQMNIPKDWIENVDISEVRHNLPEKWILSRLSKTIKLYNHQLDRFHFNEAAKVLYDFIWNDFCDWYVEIAKDKFYGENIKDAELARVVSLKCIRTVLLLLHPYSPFITEELWSHFKEGHNSDLIISSWPKEESKLEDQLSEDRMVVLQEVVTAIRSIRSRMNVPPSKPFNLVVRCSNDQESFLNSNSQLLRSLGRVEDISMGDKIAKPAQCATAVIDGMELYIPLGGLVDLDQEKARMDKRILEIDRLLTGIKSKLSNKNFLERAPETVVSKEMSNLDKLNEELEKVKANLEMLQ